MFINYWLGQTDACRSDPDCEMNAQTEEAQVQVNNISKSDCSKKWQTRANCDSVIVMRSLHCAGHLEKGGSYYSPGFKTTHSAISISWHLEHRCTWQHFLPKHTVKLFFFFITLLQLIFKQLNQHFWHKHHSPTCTVLTTTPQHWPI